MIVACIGFYLYLISVLSKTASIAGFFCRKDAIKHVPLLAYNTYIAPSSSGLVLGRTLERTSQQGMVILPTNSTYSYISIAHDELHFDFLSLLEIVAFCLYGWSPSS